MDNRRNESNRRIILCLGPHRSGTSLVSAALDALGCDLRIPSTVHANEDNRKGFFEHPRVVSFNDRLLAALEAAWDVPDFDGAVALQRAGDGLVPWREEAVELVRHVFEDTRLAALKDPRISILLPFWTDVLHAGGFDEVACVHVVRDPVEVAYSQQARQGRTPDYYEIGRRLAEGAALWLSYTAQSLQHAPPGRHCVVSYAAFLADPQASLRQLGEFLRVDPDPVRAERFSRDFVDPALYRSRVSEEDRAEVARALPEAAEVFEALLPVAGAGPVGREAFADALSICARPETREALVCIGRRAGARLVRDWREASLERARLRTQLEVSRKEAEALREDRDRRVEAYESSCAQIGAQLELCRKESEALRADRDRRVAAYELEREVRERRYERTTTRLRQVLSGRKKQLEDLRAAEARLGSAQCELQGKLDEIWCHLQATRASRSWRVTGPLRFFNTAGRQILSGGEGAWIPVNRLARHGYRRLAARRPGLAARLRRTFWPALMASNRLFLGRNYVPLVPTQPAASGVPSLFQTVERGEAEPLVTVIVPNYNHAPYLRQRLESVFGQTWRNLEVLLMDDCSSDGSREILREFAERYSDRTRLILNEERSGGVFHQWEKGLREARGELVWIAESDDWCSTDFLETLVPFFRNQAVQLAYAATDFMSGDGATKIWSMEEYLADLGAERWNVPFVVPAPQIVREAFALRNIIPNVSSAVFRRVDRLDVLGIDDWRRMRTCGDWAFYLNLIRGGLLAYSPETRNYYRIHQSNTSVRSYAEDSFYEEHEAVARLSRRLYRVNDEVFRRQWHNLRLHWAQNRGGLDEAAFDRCYSLRRILDEQRRAPNLLMVGYAFCAGGGESFPIQLANLMKTADYTVTYLDCAQEPEVKGVRDMLARDVPLVSDFANLLQVLEAFDIDIVHSHHAWVDNTILDLLPKDSRVRTVVTLHGMYETIPDASLKHILPRLVARTDKLIYTARKNTEALVSRNLVRLDELERIDNALARSSQEPVDRTSLGIGPGAFVLTIVSRALVEKGWDEAIEAVKRARGLSGRDIHLILIGEGPEYERLRDKSPSFVHFEGFRPNIRSYFAASDMGFLPSRFRGESFPLVAIDCLNAGRPFLASSVGEIPYMLDTSEGPAGALFDLENWGIPVDRLSRLIAELATDPDEVERLAARVPLAAEKFDPLVMRDHYDAAYRQLLDAQEEFRGAA